jgi:hypothetical protein
MQGLRRDGKSLPSARVKTGGLVLYMIDVGREGVLRMNMRTIYQLYLARRSLLYVDIHCTISMWQHYW